MSGVEELVAVNTAHMCIHWLKKKSSPNSCLTHSKGRNLQMMSLNELSLGSTLMAPFKASSLCVFAYEKKCCLAPLKKYIIDLVHIVKVLRGSVQF